MYLLLERLKRLTIRNLFKHVHGIMKSTKIQFRMFQIAMRCAGVDLDLDEVQCILANLIFEQKIKGYLSHEHQTLVVSKDTPFPS